jgi:hypothetical protein
MEQKKVNNSNKVTTTALTGSACFVHRKDVGEETKNDSLLIPLMRTRKNLDLAEPS